MTVCLASIFLDCCVTLFIVFACLCSTHCYCASISVCVCSCAPCVCRHWRWAFHSWIKPGQRPRGLQVNVAYFKWLFLHGHSVSGAHILIERRIAARKSLRMWFAHLFICPKRHSMLFENSLHVVTVLYLLFWYLVLTSFLLIFYFHTAYFSTHSCFLCFAPLFHVTEGTPHFS